jgi:23S rRNA A2030 N6-methylase RlmJ
MSTFNPADKAGNRGDVVKHAVLVAVLDELYAALPPAGGFSFYDAFSAGGQYELQAKGEWVWGIKDLYSRSQSASWGTIDRVAKYLKASCDPSSPEVGTMYRGSSVIAAERASAAKRSVSIHAWDTNASCIKQLKGVFKARGQSQVLKAVASEMPSGAAAGADLLFIDPPGRQTWEQTLKRLVFQGKEPNALMVWLPVSGNSKVGSALPQGVAGPLWQIVVLWGPLSGGPAQAGCELLLSLPAAAWSAANDAAAQVVATMGPKWSVKSCRLQ